MSSGVKTPADTVSHPLFSEFGVQSAEPGSRPTLPFFSILSVFAPMIVVGTGCLRARYVEIWSRNRSAPSKIPTGVHAGFFGESGAARNGVGRESVTMTRAAILLSFALLAFSHAGCQMPGHGSNLGGYAGNCASGNCGSSCAEGNCGTGHVPVGEGFLAALHGRDRLNGLNGGPAGPAAAAYSYPYYTTRGPRDFLLDQPPTIGR